MGLRLKIRQGSTYRRKFRWEVEPFVYRPIVGISSTAPCVLNCPEHGLLADQLFIVENAKGLTTLNHADPSVLTGWQRATVVDPDTIQLNRVNASALPAHTPNTGNIRYRSVVDLADYKAVLTVKDRLGGTVLFKLDSDNVGEITIDLVNQWLDVFFDDEDVALITSKHAVYDLDAIHKTLPSIYTIASGSIVIERE